MARTSTFRNRPVSELGRAQSVVYLARDPHFAARSRDQDGHFSRPDPQKNQQLLSEARMVSQLSHPNIVPIFEGGRRKVVTFTSSSSTYQV